MLRIPAPLEGRIWTIADSFQLSATMYEAQELVTHDVATQNTFRVDTEQVCDVVDMDFLRNIGTVSPSVVFGIYHNTVRENGEIFLRDWTQIPTSMVAGWRMAMTGEHNIHEFLASPLPSLAR
ncbi:hypothetical protein ACHAPJ_007507 [Fusarium lateritium]